MQEKFGRKSGETIDSAKLLIHYLYNELARALCNMGKIKSLEGIIRAISYMLVFICINAQIIAYSLIKCGLFYKV